MTNKSKYQAFAASEKEIPIFARPWYLDAVCQTQNEGWDVVLIEKGDKIVASLPYYFKNHGPFKISVMPFLTKFLGPYFSKDFRSQKQQRKLSKLLIEQLPSFAFFNQNCFYHLKDWLPFYWNGFSQTTSYSYVLDDLSDLDKVYTNINTDYRNNKIKKAKSMVRVVDNLSIEQYYQIESMSFERQGLHFQIPLSFIKKYDEVMQAHNCRKILFAIDESNQVHSVAYLLIDHDRVYYHMAGDNPQLRSSGAGILLIWEAIQYTSNELGLNTFDFEGSTIESIERVRRRFNAKQVPYFNLSKYGSRLYKIMKLLKG